METRGSDHLENLDVDGRTILKRIFKNEMGWRGLDSSDPGQGPLVGACACGDDPSGSIKCGEFVD